MCLVLFFNLSYPLACNFIMIHVCVFFVSDISITRIKEMKMMHVKNAHSRVSSDGSTVGCSRPHRHARFEHSTVWPKATRALKSWNWDPIFDYVPLRKRPWNNFSVSIRFQTLTTCSTSFPTQFDTTTHFNGTKTPVKIILKSLQTIWDAFQ